MMPPSGTNRTTASPLANKRPKLKHTTADPRCPMETPSNQTAADRHQTRHRTASATQTGTNHPPPTFPRPTDCPTPTVPQPNYPTQAFAISASTQPISTQVAQERRNIDKHYGLDCTLNQLYRRIQQHRLQHLEMYRLCTGGLLTGTPSTPSFTYKPPNAHQSAHVI